MTPFIYWYLGVSYSISSELCSWRHNCSSRVSFQERTCFQLWGVQLTDSLQILIPSGSTLVSQAMTNLRLSMEILRSGYFYLTKVLFHSSPFGWQRCCQICVVVSSSSCSILLHLPFYLSLASPCTPLITTQYTSCIPNSGGPSWHYS